MLSLKIRSLGQMHLNVPQLFIARLQVPAYVYSGPRFQYLISIERLHSIDCSAALQWLRLTTMVLAGSGHIDPTRPKTY